MPIPEKEQIPNDPLKPIKGSPDKHDLIANEKLLKARGYVLFTIDDTEGNMAFNLDLTKVNDLESIGMLTIAIDALEKVKARIENANSMGDDDDDDDDCDGECENCDHGIECNDDDD